jgi:hypothetical protein
LRSNSNPGDVQSWLRSHGVNVSSEDSQAENGKGFRDARTWDDGVSSSYFTLHTRPNNNTGFNRCLRIYFKINEDGIVSIGWIGPKPD